MRVTKVVDGELVEVGKYIDPRGQRRLGRRGVHRR
jgi:hypothetical protein